MIESEECNREMLKLKETLDNWRPKTMKKQIESIILENKNKQRLRIYKCENSNSFFVGLEDAEDHFEFDIESAEEITQAINQIVDSFS